jgi:REP element-mobilizing transposase RayT
MNSDYLKKLYPQRRALRLPEYDYSSHGAYFVTICTHEKKCLFGQVIDDSMVLNKFGEIVWACWQDIPYHYPDVNNEIFIVMPNHVHGIIFVQDSGLAGSKPAPTKKHPLSEIVRAFKSFSSRRINEYRNTPGQTIWQRGYYDHVIEGEEEYAQVGEYILFNPSKWIMDHENPNCKK